MERLKKEHIKLREEREAELLRAENQIEETLEASRKAALDRKDLPPSFSVMKHKRRFSLLIPPI